MCRAGGRRCPSSLGRRHGGTRPTRDSYTTHAAALARSPQSLTRVSRGLTASALGFLPKNEKGVVPKDVLSDTRESLASSLLHTVAADPELCGTVHSGEDDARKAYEEWRLHRGGSEKWAVPFHRLSEDGQSAVRSSLDAAVREAKRNIPEDDVLRARRTLNRDLDKASLMSLRRFHGEMQDDEVVSSAIDAMKYGDTHIPESLMADTLAAANLSEHQRDQYAAQHWLRERGIDPATVKLVMSPKREMTAATGDADKDRELTELLALEWDGDGEPNGRALNERFRAISERNADRGIRAEFSSSRNLSSSQLPFSVAQALKNARAVAELPKRPRGSRPLADHLAAVEACVGGGNVKRAEYLLSGKATHEELADELARLETIPARYKKPGTAGALEDLDKRAVLIEAGVHPRHLDSPALPPEAAERVRHAIQKRIVDAGENYYDEEPMDDEWMARSLEERAAHLTSTLTVLNGSSEHHMTVGTDMGFLVDESTVALGRRRATQRTAPVDPSTTMDPLF